MHAHTHYPVPKNPPIQKKSWDIVLSIPAEKKKKKIRRKKEKKIKKKTQRKKEEETKKTNQDKLGNTGEKVVNYKHEKLEKKQRIKIKINP